MLFTCAPNCPPLTFARCSNQALARRSLTPILPPNSPNRYHEGVFACYEHFLEDADALGNPPTDASPRTLKAWQHLALLLASAIRALAAQVEAARVTSPAVRRECVCVCVLHGIRCRASDY